MKSIHGRLNSRSGHAFRWIASIEHFSDRSFRKGFPMARSMIQTTVLAIAGTLGMSLLVACGSQPIPMTAQAGSTITFTMELHGNYGYGGSLLTSKGIFDDQRGQLIFELVDPGDPTARHPLETVLVTRAFADPASTYHKPVIPGQVIALVNIPADTPEGTYDLDVMRERRTSETTTELLAPPGYVGQITVLPHSIKAKGESVVGTPTPLEGTLLGLFDDRSNEIAATYPKPMLQLGFAPGNKPRPHAAHLVISYPASKMQPLWVIDLGARSSIVTWSIDEINAEITVDLASPDAKTRALGIVFELVDPFGAGPVDLTDFALVSGSFYNGNGAGIARDLVFVSIL
jgi:hypothetical protein